MHELTVRCTIDNCHYWGQGNVCAAREILITSDRVGGRYPQHIDTQQLSTILDEVVETPASRCEETCCKTFKAKR